MASQLPLAHAIVINDTMPGTGNEIGSWLKEHYGGPVLRSATVPTEDTGWLKGQRVVAWAGIAGPARFFALLEQLGAVIVDRIAFPDHVAPAPDRATQILHVAQAAGAVLVSTEKDLVRLVRQSGPLAALAAATKALPIRLVFGTPDREQLASLVASAIK